MPNTVIFNYNIDEVEADSFFIQQSWDKNRRVRIYKNNYTLTDIYYEPGYHTAKLIANDSIIKTVPVNIPTNGWFFYANEYKTRYHTEYIKVLSPNRNGYLSITTDDLKRSGVHTDREKMYLYSLFSKRLNISGDNFKLRTRVRMKEIINNFCSYITLELYSQKHFILVKSTSQGCASEAMLSFAEKKISGRNTDLTSTTYNVREWTEIEVDVKNKHFTLYINGKKSFKGDYRADMKSITGLSFISNGLCEVEYIELKGQDGKVAYKSNFKDSVEQHRNNEPTSR
ncbi:hypothetical protein ACFSJU_19175 [Paradesertivirga mongoliensis]|uniref:Uncharacterized protein n=1 Tax=Paradesertivirga mongoliensis TaxID=2100740 RepID=A0ABW4ZS69_9SPHI|nr:hypothetical protein [Pedobacter mongoliensis]